MVNTGPLFRGGVALVEHCPVRKSCPAGKLCGIERSEGLAPLYPTIEEVEHGELVWTDLRYEQRVRLVRRGVFAFTPNFAHDESIVTSIYGVGLSLGLAELYIPRDVAGTYHLRAITEGALCSFPAKAFKRHIESLPTAESNELLACAFTNIVESDCVQMRTVSKTSLYERIVLLLARLRNLSARQGIDLDEVKLTHEELAELAASDRASVTRTLHKLKQDGMIELGYKTIKYTDALKEYALSCVDVFTNFQTPKASQ